MLFFLEQPHPPEIYWKQKYDFCYIALSAAGGFKYSHINNRTHTISNALEDFYIILDSDHQKLCSSHNYLFLEKYEVCEENHFVVLQVVFLLALYQSTHHLEKTYIRSCL